MNYITALINHFLQIPVEKFTDKLISAFQIAEVCDFDKESKNKLNYIEHNTHEDVCVSFYMLDRQINPETTGFKRQGNSAKFIQNKPKNEDGERPQIKLPEEQIQRYLCIAVREVAEIVMRNTKEYNLEFKLPNSSKNDNFKVNF